MPIYCDHNASTPVRPEVLDRVLPFLGEACGNASSVHALGSRARSAVEAARQQVAELIGAQPAEIVFTSGGTESNNLAIYGATRGRGRTIVTTPIEHSSVRACVADLQSDGGAAALLPVDDTGRVAAADASTRLDADGVGLLSVGWANNEIGTVQPIAEIAALARARGVWLHTDAVQAVGKIPVSVESVDLLSISGHKLGAPQGVGALFVRRGIELRPLLLGGGQERGRRGGTENVPGIVGLGEACRLAGREIETFGAHCAMLRDLLWSRLQAAVPAVRRNSPSGKACLPNTLHVSFAGVRGEALVAALDLQGVAVSSGSACAAGAGEPSHVLLALGRDPEAARDGVRFSVGRGNTVDEIELVGQTVATVVQRMRAVRGAERRHA